MKRTMAVGCGWWALLAGASLALAQAEVSVVQRVRQADEALATQDVARAEALLRQAVAQDQAYGAAWRQLGVVLLRTGRQADAVAAFQRALELDESDAQAWRGFAQSLWKEPQREEAVKALQAYLRLKPEDAGAWRDLANWEVAMQRRPEALAALEKALALKPEDAAGWKELAGLCVQLKQPEQAREYYKKAIQLSPRDAAALRDWGWLEWSLKNREAALEHLQQAVLLGVPESDRLVLQVVARLAEEGQFKPAVDFAAKTHAGTIGELGIKLLLGGRLRAAEPILQAAWDAQEDRKMTGLYLAYARAVNGHCANTAEYLNPFVAESLEHVETAQVDMLFETLQICSGDSSAAKLLAQVEKQLPAPTAADPRLTDVMESGAEAQRVKGDAAEALALYRRVLQRDPNRAAWYWAFKLMEAESGPAAATRWLKAQLKQASQPAIRHGIQGVMAGQKGEHVQAVKELEAALEAPFVQPYLRQILFENYLLLGDVKKARQQADWMQQQVDEGDSSLRSYAAEMLSTLGEPERALDHWQLLHMSNPQVNYYGLEVANALFQLCQPEEAKAVLQEMLAGQPHAHVYEMLAEIDSVLSQPVAAANWARQGLDTAPSQGLRRYLAENDEMAKTNFPEALSAALAFIKADPGYVPLTLLAGRMLTAIGETNAAHQFYADLLERNPEFLPALINLRDEATRAGRFREAVEYARRMAQVQAQDPEARKDLANSLAQADRFGQALRILRPLARPPPHTAAPVLVYQVDAPCNYAGRNSAAQIARHLEHLASNGYYFAASFAELADTSFPKRVMVVIQDADEKAVNQIDKTLKKLSARAVYAGHDAVLALHVPGMPSHEKLEEMTASGRWQLASSGPSALRRAAIDAAGTLGNPLTHRVMDDGQREEAAAFSNRVFTALRRAAAPLQARAERILVYPFGDFGQLSLDAEAAERAILPQAAGAAFTHAIYFSDAGFYTAAADPLRIPARVVPPSWSAEDVAQFIHQGNPVVRARLETAKVLYWHRQYEAAHVWFTRAERVGADPADLNYHWGANAVQEGDVPTAAAKLRQAEQLAPADKRVKKSLKDVEDQKRWTADFQVNGWQDNEDRTYWQARGEAAGHVGDFLKPGVFVDRNRWEKTGDGHEQGTRVGGELRWYLAPQLWVDGRVWNMNMDELEDFWGGSVNLHLSNPHLGGYVDLHAARQEMETLEAVRKEIYADVFAARTYSRVLEDFDVFANLTQTQRTDDNDTTMLDGRILYRLKEWPFAGIGYRFRFADSDYDPVEYWAPERLEQHQLHLALRGHMGKLRAYGSGDAGYSREVGTGWRFTWGGRLGGEVPLTRRAALYGEANYMEGPVYNRTFWELGVKVRL